MILPTILETVRRHLRIASQAAAASGIGHRTRAIVWRCVLLRRGVVEDILIGDTLLRPGFALLTLQYGLRARIYSGRK
jgi:hypothetical protein